MSLPPLGTTAAPAVVRTDFSDQAAWEALCAGLRQPSPGDGFLPAVELIDKREYEGASVKELLLAISADYQHPFIAVADGTALQSKDQPLLVIDLHAERGREFRAAVAAMWAVENNLSLANMDFFEFADAVDDDGVFREFRD